LVDSVHAVLHVGGLLGVSVEGAVVNHWGEVRGRENRKKRNNHQI
jgi:hypothetical protein